MCHLCVCAVGCSDTHLGLDYPVHDGFHCFQSVALHHALKVLGAVSEGLGHRHVQVVVGLLCCQVLDADTQTHRHTHANMHAHTHRRTHANMHAHTHTQAHTHTHTHTHIFQVIQDKQIHNSAVSMIHKFCRERHTDRHA